MQFPFRLKLGLVITIISVGLTSLSVYFVYSSSKTNAARLMGARLKGMGKTGSFMFEDKERQAMIRLKKQILDNSLNTQKLKEDIAKRGPGEYAATLPESVSLQIQESADFQSLIQVLRKIKNGSRKNVTYPQTLPQLPLDENDKPLIQYVYLFIEAQDISHPDTANLAVYRFLADADYESIDVNKDGKISEKDAAGADSHDEFGNAVGNFYIVNRKTQNFFIEAFLGQPSAGEDFYEEEFGTLFSAAVPIKDKSGSVIAILGMDYRADSEADDINRLFWICVLIVISAFIISLIVAFVMANMLNRPIKALREGAEKVANRDFNTNIKVTSRDEFGMLAKTFNGMVDEIREYAHSLEAINTAYYRFVPREFLEHLERKSVVEVELGDQVQKEMTVLFSDIRSFTTLSEGMTPKDNFNFLNGYLGYISPIIRHHSGFVDKYIGDAVMALFLSVDDALQAGIAMHQKLIEYNKIRLEQGYQSVNIGIGLHSGNLMLGTVGESKRMESTVISDAVNLSSRLEGLTKKFGAKMMISQKVYDECKIKYSFRYLGKVKVKGKSGSQKVYEVLDAESDEMRKLKLATQANFEKGIALFQKGMYKQTIVMFKKILEINPDDQAVKEYIKFGYKLLKQKQTIHP